MPDLHGWITQQVDETEHVARRAASYDDGASHDVAGPEGTWAHLDDSEWFGASCRGGVIAPRIGYTNAPELGAHIIRHDPAAVLRRCAADRKILARHRLNPDAYWSDAAMCEGCGTTSDCDWPVTDNLNDCPELLDLAEGYGLTPEILAGLDRPQRGERPDYPGETGNIIPDSIASMYGAMYKQVMETTLSSISAAENLLVTGDPAVEPRLWARKIPGAPIPEWLREDLGLPLSEPEPTPGERAFAVVEPHLSALALYKPTTNPEA